MRQAQKREEERGIRRKMRLSADQVLGIRLRIV